MSDDGTYWVIRGNWTLSNGMTGQFELLRGAPEGESLKRYPPPPPPQAPPPPPQHWYQGSWQPVQGYPPASYNQAPNDALLDDFDVCDGDKGDIERVIAKLQSGRTISGAQYWSLVNLIENEEDVMPFTRACKSQLREFELSHLVEALRDMKFDDQMVGMAKELYHTWSDIESAGAIDKENLLDTFAFDDQRDDVRQFCGID